MQSLPPLIVHRPAFSILPLVESSSAPLVPPSPLLTISPAPLKVVSVVPIPSNVPSSCAPASILQQPLHSQPVVQSPAPLRVSSRSNKGMPYISKGAYISTPISGIQENNYLLPFNHGYAINSNAPTSQRVKIRSRCFSKMPQPSRPNLSVLRLKSKIIAGLFSIKIACMYPRLLSLLL